MANAITENFFFSLFFCLQSNEEKDDWLGKDNGELPFVGEARTALSAQNRFVFFLAIVLS